MAGAGCGGGGGFGGDKESVPVNGGEFLLKLLQNPPHHPPPQAKLTPQPSHDPAVAAFGPSVPVASAPFSPWLHQHHHNSPPPFVPHNFFVQNPNVNPVSVPLFNSTSPPGFMQGIKQQHDLQFGIDSRAENVRNLGILEPNHNPSSAQQPELKGIVFGSLKGNECILNGSSSENLLISEHLKGKMGMPLPKEGREVNLPSTRRLNGVEAENQLNPVNFGREWRGNFSLSRVHDRSGCNSTDAVNYGRQGNNGHSFGALPPPGFSGNQMGGVNRKYADRRIFEQTGESGRNSSVAARHQRDKIDTPRDRRFMIKNEKINGDRRVTDQLDFPGPFPGTCLHSVSSSDIEESMMELHSAYSDRRGPTVIGMEEKTRDGHKGHSDLDDLEEQFADFLDLEDESGGKESVNNKRHGTRDKDYRSDKRGQAMLSQRMRYSKKNLPCPADIDRLSAPFIAIYESLIPPEEEKVKQKQLFSLLERIVSQEWPDARLYIYGSCANSFGFSKSDIDVCLRIDDADFNKSEILLKLADMLQSENLQNVQALTRARVPIVKLMDPATGISCDICINNMLAVVNTKLLHDYAQIDVRLRHLAFIVKHWAKSRGVNETYQGTLSSYAYVLMCIHFLQQRRPPILPCLQEMRITHYAMVDNVVCAYFDQVEDLVGFGSRNQESIGKLVWAFFNYWAYRHDYANDVISVRTGSTMRKHSKDWTRRIGNDRHLICIEDPFEITHDLGRVVDKRSIKVLREEFERAAEIMQFDLNPCVKLFEPYIPT